MARMLMEVIRDALRTHHYSYRIEETNFQWIRRFIRFNGCQHPCNIGAAEIQGFLSGLAVRGRVSASAQNQTLSSILFLYRKVQQAALPWMDDINRAKRPA